MSKTPSKRNPVARFMNIFNRASTHKTRTTQTSREDIAEGLAEVVSTSLRSSSPSKSMCSSYSRSSKSDSYSSDCSSSSDSGSSGGGCD